MPGLAWKEHEKRIREKVDGVRPGVTGLPTPDVITEDWCIEAKNRKRLPQWIVQALVSAKRKAIGEQTGIVVLHEKYKHGSLVVMGFNDFLDRFNDSGSSPSLQIKGKLLHLHASIEGSIEHPLSECANCDMQRRWLRMIEEILE